MSSVLSVFVRFVFDDCTALITAHGMAKAMSDVQLDKIFSSSRPLSSTFSLLFYVIYSLEMYTQHCVPKAGMQVNNVSDDRENVAVDRSIMLVQCLLLASTSRSSFFTMPLQCG